MARLSLVGFQRSLTMKLVALAGMMTLLLTLFSLHPSSSAFTTTVKSSLSGIMSGRKSTPCSPALWASGQWNSISPRLDKPNASSVADVLAFEGFQGCASDREYKWHLAADDDQFSRFPDVASFRWTPPDSCKIRAFEQEAVVIDMVEKGGWLLIGDSVTENHFFSLSCLLYPHVRATPNYTENPYFDRAWPQNLYLNPSSPLIPHIRFPPGFNISITPLVTFRRVDLLLTQEQIRAVYRKEMEVVMEGEGENRHEKELLGGDQVWEVAPSEYLSIFSAPLPEGNYGTLVVSTAGHWTVGTFRAFLDYNLPGDGIDKVLELFEHSMRAWAGLVQGFMETVEPTRGGRERRVVARAYLPGHDNCHNIFKPWQWYEQEGQNLSWNWGKIPTMNKIFEDVLSAPQFKQVDFLATDRPGLLRPDAHGGGDCLHWMSGAGVLEGWSEYIWHYITREVPQKSH